MLESLTGTTSPDRRRILLAHFDECAVCRREAAAIEETAAMLRAVPDPKLQESYWPEFMSTLEQRIARELMGWRRLIRMLRTPRVAWSAAAATSVLVVVLGLVLFTQPFQQTADESGIDLSGAVTESVVESLPSMSDSLTSWKAGLSAPDISYELVSVGGK